MWPKFIFLYCIFFFAVPGCNDTALVGNGFCNDETNTEICNYDGGDCCLNVVNKTQCSDCTCYLEEFCTTGFHPSIGDGFCNDETNIAKCGYDGGDCCRSYSNTDHCSNCTCYGQELCKLGFTPSSVGDGFCNDNTNNEECYYDGGDCCGFCVIKDYCSDCVCLQGSSESININPLINNGYCNEEANILECNYDSGHCCGPDISCKRN